MREHFASGVAHALAGRGEEALADFDFVTRSLSQVSDGWYNRGVALTMLARPGRDRPNRYEASPIPPPCLQIRVNKS